MAGSKLKQGLASVFQSEEQIFEQQKKYGRIIYYVAWGVEIGAALVGLFLAWNLALIAYNKLPEIEQTTYAQARALGGALPFVIIALIEPTKIYLSSGLYHAKPMGWKLLFSFGLLALTFVTFETMYNGLIQQNVNVSRSVQQLQNERSNKLTLLREKGNELERVRARTPEALSRESEAKKASQEASRAEQIKVENQSFQDWFDNSYKPERATILGGKDQNFQQIERERASLVTRMENAQKNYNQQRQQILDDFSNRRAEQNQKRQENSKIIAEGSGFFTGVTQAAINDAQTQIATIDNELKRFSQQEDQALNQLEGDYVKFIEVMEKNLNQLGKSGGDSEANQQLASLDLQLKIKQDERDDAISNINRRFEATMAVYEENKAKFDAEGAQNVDRETELGQEIKALIEEDGELKKDYRIQAADLQTVQLTKTACGIFSSWCFGKKTSSNTVEQTANTELVLDGDVENTALIYISKQSDVSQTIDLADLPTDKIDKIGSLWFASIAIIVATLGTFLAFTSFVLQDQKSYQSETSTTITDFIKNLGSGLQAAGVGLGRFLIDNGKASSEFIRSSAAGFGGGIRSILTALGSIFTAVGGMFSLIGKSFRKMTLDIRRSVRAPKIKFETIEKEVVVEKEVEVVVEKEKVVIKEVPVEVVVEKEKVVIKEVPKEIVRKEIVYVPLYSTENGKVLMEADLLTGAADKTFRTQPKSLNEDQET